MNFSVFDWNLQGTNYFTSIDFNRIAPVLENTKADIFCFQEADRLIEQLDRFEHLKRLYCIYPDGSNNKNLLLSTFPIVAGGNVIFPEPTGRRWTPLENALWADLAIDTQVVRIYNCHFGIVGSGPRERAEQLRFLMADAEKHSGPVVICGDLNTTIPPAGMKRKIVQWFHREADESIMVDDKPFACDERYAFVKLAEREGFREATDISKSTWSLVFGWELFHLKLDWFLVRGLKTPEVSMSDYVSDHKAIVVECSL